MANVLVISTHPDDETLGMGGTLLKKRIQGDFLSWMIITSAYGPRWDEKAVQEKEAEIASVAKPYQFQKTFRLDFPAAALNGSHRSDLLDSIRKGLEEAKPDQVYLMFGRDIHTDHQLAFDCALSVMKPFRYPGIRQIYCYETLSSTEMAAPLSGNAFLPNAYCDISDYIDEKIRIMELYRTESQAFPLPRSPESTRALARFRGSTAGVPYTESFMVLREVL